MTEPAAPPPFVVAIPARYGSTRLPGKPLQPIAGEPMIVHVARRALAAGAAEVVVATDDVFVFARRHLPLAFQYVHSLDVWQRTRNALGDGRIF